MGAMGADSADAVDVLRRRVYRPGATEADVSRYREALPTARPAATSVPPRRRRAPVLPVAGAGVVTAALATVLATASAPAPPAGALHASAAERSAFVHRLEAGRDADLSDWFLNRPSARPPQLTTLLRAATEEHAGTGSSAVALRPSDLADGGGRVTVVLTSAAPGRIGWRAARVATRADGSSSEQAVAGRSVWQPAGLPVATTVEYRGIAASQLIVSAPAGVRWDALVVFSD